MQSTTVLHQGMNSYAENLYIAPNFSENMSIMQYALEKKKKEETAGIAR